MTSPYSDQDMAFHFTVSQFLYREARLLDEQQFKDWHQLLAEDLHYRMPVRRSHYLRNPVKHAVDTDHYDDDFSSMGLRIERMVRPGMASLDPAARETRAVSNIEVQDTDTEGEYLVRSIIQLSRNRLLDQQEELTARREDILRLDSDTGFKITRRTAWINHNVILMRNLSCLL